ncbi:putative integral membrane protein (TIGR00698 family) [Actinoallomurus bryophytorum]|uniref:Putative integral membrane protein (TIGR00698 family) n=1 Tax=Actinoallomurus bryophytorum TaxID=1490222 RepID=A0A543CRW4_9ACTN|nr:putative integral membrane protein (TIGR00698 family) [Actinoallomurus bryophytorum]
MPGLAACAAGLLVAWSVHRLVGAVPMLTAALLLGIVAVNTGVLPSATRAGSRFAASTVMRAGVVLLGLQVALTDIAGLGWQTIVMTVLVLLATLFGTRWLGSRMGLSARTSLLVASGFAICGASAVAAVDGVLGHDRDDDRERDAATAVALVTLCGTLAIVVMPAAGHLLGLSAYDQGRWIGASVHDVGQVVATATVAGPAALLPAVAVKLIRVAMLAPVTTAIALRVRHAGPAAGPAAGAKRPPVLPVFLIAFLAMVALRSTGAVPQGVLDTASTVKDLLFAAALFGLGSAVRLGPLIRTGRRALLLGLTSWVMIAGISYGGVLLTR